MNPRRVSVEKFPEWAQKNLRAGDIVVLETTTNVWDTYDIVAPLVSRVLVANVAAVGEIAGARVKTDKEDIKHLLKLLFGGIVPEVWVPPGHVRELRAFISYCNRLVIPVLAGGARENRKTCHSPHLAKRTLLRHPSSSKQLRYTHRSGITGTQGC